MSIMFFTAGLVTGIACMAFLFTAKGVIVDSTYYPNSRHYDYEERANVTHFAYIEEIKNTVPPCPVCSGTDAANQLDPHAYQSAL